MALPATLVVVAWGALGLLLVEIGLKFPFSSLRKIGHFIALLSFGRFFMANIDTAGHSFGISHRLLIGAPLFLLYCHLFYRCADESESALSNSSERTFIRVYLYLPVLLLVALCRFKLGRGMTTPAWGILSIVLQILGNKLQLVDLRRQSVILAGIAVAHGWGTDLKSLDQGSFISERWVIGLTTIASLYICQAMAPRESLTRVHDFEREPTGIGYYLEERGRIIYSIGGSFLLAFLLYLEVSGSLLSLGWAVQGVVLLLIGFYFRDKSLRYFGLVLFLVCILKLFFYDLRNLEVPFRILSFIILGLILMGISWFYTRYQEKIKEYL